MNLGLISLIALLAAIVIGFVRKANVGILCIGFSMILGLVYGIKAGDIIKGFSSSLGFHKLTDNGTLRSQRAHTSGHNAEIADDCRHDRVHTCGYRNRDRDDRNDRERRDSSRSHRTDQESEQVHDERDQRLVRSDKRYHFFCEKLQSSVFVDDGKEISDTDHRDEA